MFKRYRKLVTIGLLLMDVLLINIAFALAYWIRYEMQWFRAVDAAYDIPFRRYLPLAILLTLLLLIIYWGGGIYRQRRGASWFDKAYTLLNGTTTGIVFLVFIAYFYRPLSYSRLIFFYAGALIVLLLSLSRLGKAWLWAHLRRKGIGVERVLIVGAGEIGRTLMRHIVAQPELGYQIVGFVDDDPQRGSTDIGRFHALGGIPKLSHLIQEEEVDEVFITLPWTYHRKILAIVDQCEREQVRARIVPDLFQLSLSRVDVDNIGGVPVIGLREPKIGVWQRAFKRSLDLIVALAGLILFSPLFPLIGLAIKLDSPGPVLFTQTRVGRAGRSFTIYKFRSMREGAEEEKGELADLNEASGPIFKIQEDPRLTSVGRVLRRWSLDELPQLYNVLRGEMSLVGPRPPTPAEVAQYEDWHMKRLAAHPGITGLWQVSGRSELPFDEMVLLDIYYVENWSPALDAKILLRTVPKWLSGKGAY
ncbi:MAG: undecaprenyl-phosphate glucose phosphotransferase [Chloroflexota bacterium]|nr:undecaprenyl-phosphate glucose phosphotransferase [Chloroflexota bacterium]